MKSVTTRRFRAAEAALPADVQKAAVKAFKQWKRNPRHPALRYKNIVPDQSIYSVRVTLDYRAVGLLQEDTMVWFWIGNHGEYEKLIKQLQS